MIRKIYYSVLLIIISVLVQFCANVAPLAGGLKDETAPKLEVSEPPNRSVNFAEKKFILTFDEYVKLDKLDQNLVISPPLKNKPEIRLRSKSVVVLINNELQDSTTYTFNFGNSIADINEGNVFERFKYVFATGSSIDSLMLKGSVLNARDHTPVEDSYVFLYKINEDSLPLTSLPSYLAKTSKDGSFEIDNIGNGQYKLFALIDADNNLKFNMPNEAIAFMDDMIAPWVRVDSVMDTLKIRKDSLLDDSFQDSIVVRQHITYGPDSLILYSFIEESPKQYLIKSERQEKWKLCILMNQRMEQEFVISPIGFITKDHWFVPEYSTNRDTLLFWITDSTVYQLDTFKLQCKYSETDTIGSIFIKLDTITFKVKAVKEKKKKEKSPPTIDTLIISSNLTPSFDLNTPVKISASHPILDWDTSQIILYHVVDTLKQIIPYSIQKDSVHIRSFVLAHKVIEGDKYSLFIGPGAFTSVYSFRNDTIIKDFIYKKADQYGKILLTVKNITCPVIVQLLAGKDKILREYTIEKDGVVVADFLKPDKYKFKIIMDANGNQKWDTGKYSDHLQPEKVVFFTKELDVKANWEIEEEWILE